jgi:hypothetical protein
MTEEELRVADLVHQAFQGVILGDGVGLLQGQCLDDYADSKTIAEMRAQDEKLDWSRIAASELNTCHSSLSFFDAQGMRFHLPAYLIAHLEGLLTQDIIFHLVCFNYGMESRFTELNDLQRTAVREFLLLMLSDPYREFDRPMIENALAVYWTESQRGEIGI